MAVGPSPQWLAASIRLLQKQMDTLGSRPLAVPRRICQLRLDELIPPCMVARGWSPSRGSIEPQRVRGYGCECAGRCRCETVCGPSRARDRIKSGARDRIKTFPKTKRRERTDKSGRKKQKQQKNEKRGGKEDKRERKKERTREQTRKKEIKEIKEKKRAIEHAC